MYTEYLRAPRKTLYPALGWSEWRSGTASCRRWRLHSHLRCGMFIKEERCGKRVEGGRTRAALRILVGDAIILSRARWVCREFSSD